MHLQWAHWDCSCTINVAKFDLCFPAGWAKHWQLLSSCVTNFRPTKFAFGLGRLDCQWSSPRIPTIRGMWHVATRRTCDLLPELNYVPNEISQTAGTLPVQLEGRLGIEGESSGVCIDFDLVIWFIKKFQIEHCWCFMPVMNITKCS